MKKSSLRKKLQISSNKKIWKFIGAGLAAFLLAGIAFFFTYFRVTHVEVMGSSHYTESEVQEMILQGPLAYNSVLAPLLCSTDDAGDIPFVEGFRVKQMNRSTIVISVKEKQPVGCIPYLDSYIYFDRNGIFIESSRERAEKIPYFDGIQVDSVVKNEKLPIKGNTILNTAVALSTIFQKNDMLPEHIQFDENYQISLLYGDITVKLGKDENLEDKMAKVFAILPLISGKKGILHLESVTDSGKPTFEMEKVETSSENWTGGYDENGEYTETGEYDENGNYVGPKPDSAGDTGEPDSYNDDSYQDDSYNEDGSGEDSWEEDYQWEDDSQWDDSYSGDSYEEDGYYEDWSDTGDYGYEDWSDEPYYEDY